MNLSLLLIRETIEKCNNRHRYKFAAIFLNEMAFLKQVNLKSSHFRNLSKINLLLFISEEIKIL